MTDEWLAPAAERTCVRCGRVLVGEDDGGIYYQVAESDERAPGLVFMARVHACDDGQPHRMRIYGPDAPIFEIPSERD